MNYTEYDVIIVGGRVAGSSLAILLGRQGRRVLMLDRDAFPSDTLSTHLVQPPAVEMLEQLGARQEIEARGVRRLTRQRTYLGDVILEGTNRAPGLYSLCVRRDLLDWTLIRHALCYPSVEFAERTSVERLIWEDGRVAGVCLRTPEGERHEVRARVVVGADGKYSKVADWVGAGRYDEVPALRPVYYGYYHGVQPLPEPAVEVFYQQGRIGYLLPMEPGRDCFTMEFEPEQFGCLRADPAGMLDAAVRSLPGMAVRMAGATLVGEVWGTRGVDNCLRVPAGPGWALTGDAAMSKDPSTGTGIEDAFKQSFLLAEALGAALNGADWDTTMAAYHQQRDKAVMSSYRSTLAFTQAGEIPAEALAWLQGVAASAGFARTVAMAFPAMVQAANVLPQALAGAIERSAARFAEAEAQGLESAA